MNNDKKISKSLMVFIIVITILWFFAKLLLCFVCITNNIIIGKILNIFVDLPEMISILFIPLIIIILPDIYKNITEEKWYPEKIDINLLDRDKLPLEKYELEIINNLMKNKNKEEFEYQKADNKYFDYVFQLQGTDAEFNLMWNNLNYFKNKGKPVQIKYWEIIVYRRIINYLNKKNE